MRAEMPQCSLIHDGRVHNVKHLVEDEMTLRTANVEKSLQIGEFWRRWTDFRMNIINLIYSRFFFKACEIETNGREGEINARYYSLWGGDVPWH